MLRTLFIPLSGALLALAAVGTAQAVQPREWRAQDPPYDTAIMGELAGYAFVTVSCGANSGTGWSANVSLSAEQQAAGYHAYVITDMDNIEGCITYQASVPVTYEGATATGMLMSWSYETGLAGILTTLEPGPLTWERNPYPVVGQWVGAEALSGGSLTPVQAGTITSVGTDTLQTTIPGSALLNGAPLLDNRGRVLGIMTSSGQVTGAPQLCTANFLCNAPTHVWWSGLRVPGAPTDVVAKPGNRSAVVAWWGPDDDGGSPVYGYTVTASPGGQTCDVYQAVKCTITGLTNGTAYTFTVVGYNAAGDGFASAPSKAVIPRTKPGPVSGLVARALVGAISVSWSPPTSTGGVRISGYQYRIGTGTWVRTTATTVRLTARSGLLMRVSVRALNAAGAGAIRTVQARAK